MDGMGSGLGITPLKFNIAPDGWFRWVSLPWIAYVQGRTVQFRGVLLSNLPQMCFLKFGDFWHFFKSCDLIQEKKVLWCSFADSSARVPALETKTIARWWFQRFFIFTPTWGNDPIWLIFCSKELKPPTSRVYLDQREKSMGWMFKIFMHQPVPWCFILMNCVILKPRCFCYCLPFWPFWKPAGKLLFLDGG